MQNRSQIPSFRKTFFRKYLVFAKSILLFAKSNKKIFFSQSRSQISYFRKTFFRKYLLFVKSIANIFFQNRSFFSQNRSKSSFCKIDRKYLLFAKPSFGNIFFLPNRSQIPSFRKIDRKYLSQTSFCKIDASFRKTDRKNLLFAKSIANTLFSQNLLWKISVRQIDRKYLHFV